MLIEQTAYANRWRAVAPSAKGLFALGGFVAAFVAGAPALAFAVAAFFMLTTIVGAGVPPLRYLRVVLPALSFLALGSASLAFTLGVDAQGGIAVGLLPDGQHVIAQVAGRSAAALSALLFLILTTPLPDLIALLRRLKCPETLLELMVLCYRMLFVFSEALADTRSAQAARLGYATPRLALRSLGSLAANLTIQIWQRASDLHVAAQARNNDGPLRFLPSEFGHVRRDVAIAAVGAASLIVFAMASL